MKTKSGLATTAGSLDLEVSQRALFLCKEELALKESQLRQANTKSSVLVERVKLLESEVTKLLAAQHIHGETPPAPSFSTNSVQERVVPECPLNGLLASDLQDMKTQLANLTSAIL